MMHLALGRAGPIFCSVTVSVAMTLYHARQAGLLALPLTTKHQSQVGVNPFSLVLAFSPVVNGHCDTSCFHWERLLFLQYMGILLSVMLAIRRYTPRLNILKSVFGSANHARCP
jgi:hypothetical protein